MPNDRDLEKEVRDLRAELKRLTERVDRKAWGNPHDFAYQALSSVEQIRDYYGSGAQGVEKIREIVERLRVTAAARVSSPYAGAAFIYGLADLIEGVYIENRYHKEAHAYAIKREREERQRAQREAQKNEET
jgi:hypothetical protein